MELLYRTGQRGAWCHRCNGDLRHGGGGEGGVGRCAGGDRGGGGRHWGVLLQAGRVLPGFTRRLHLRGKIKRLKKRRSRKRWAVVCGSECLHVHLQCQINSGRGDSAEAGALLQGLASREGQRVR